MAPSFVILLFAAVAVAKDGQPLLIASEHPFRSTILDEERRILVSLPAGYETDTASYPVLYVLDGRQNMPHVVGAVEVLSRTGQIPRLIIVGIVSTNRDRDLSPSRVKAFKNSGGGPRFLDFISQELMPEIEKTYRVHDFAVLEGHSLGGALAIHAILRRPGLFDGLIVISPSLWWNQEALTEQARTWLPGPDFDTDALFLAIGSEDGRGMRQELERFVDVVRKKAIPGMRWQHRELEGEGHMSAPLLANYHGLRMVFADLQLPTSIRDDYADAAFRAHEARVTTKYGTAATQSAESYVTLANTLMQAERFAEAVTVFARAAEVYDNYPPSHAWLAAAYEKSGNPRAAIESYRTALRLSESIDVGQAGTYRAHIERLAKSE